MGKTMTGRERILAAISHEQPDRVPIDFGLSISSIVVDGYDRLKEHFGITAPNELLNRMTQVVRIDEKILREFDIDTRSLYPGSPNEGGPQDIGPREYRDEWGVERVHPENSYYYDMKGSPLSGNITVADIAKYPWPDPHDPGYTQGLRERLQWLRENTDCAVLLVIPTPFVHISQYLRGFEDWYCDFVLNTKVLEALFDAVLEVNMEIARQYLEAVGEDVDLIYCADDLGAQSGPQISHDHFSKYVKPRLEKYIRQARDISSKKILFHSCGSVESIIEDLIEIGVDALNPVQITAKDMDPVSLKKKYGGRMAFWGAMETQKILPTGSVEDVERMVEERIEQMGEGGGYVLASCHSIQPDVPTENILAMFRHAREYVPSFAK